MGLPLWSPTADRIAFYSTRSSAFGGYSLIDPDGSNRQPLMSEGAWAAWSFDGRWFYYAEQEGQRHLKKMSVDGGSILTVRTDQAGGPAPSPDGQTLYFVVEVAAAVASADYEIRRASPEDGPADTLTRIPARRIPSWQRLHPVTSPDGAWLGVALTDGVTTNLWAVSTADGALRQLTDFGERPTFIVRRVCWSPDGRSIFAAVGEGDADVVLFAGLRP